MIMTNPELKKSLDAIVKKYPQLAKEVAKQMPVDDGPDFMYEIGQTVVNEQVGEITVYDRWHGKEVNFYDVHVLRRNSTWTFDETEMIKGHNLSKRTTS